MLNFYILSFLLALFTFEIAAQPLFPNDSLVYDDQVVPEIQVWIDEDSLSAILADVTSDHEYPATFIFIHPDLTDTVFNIGFRLRGNTSRFSGKKSWKVSFNTFEQGKKFMGLEKMNINGEHNDPTIMRAKLCWDLCREMKIPAPRCNHVSFYINGDYFGLFANVEHIDEEFVQSRFDNNDGNLYKCLWGSDLTYQGDDPDNYKGGPYELKTNEEDDDFSDLAEFIKVLNLSSAGERSCKIREVFNVDDYLKSMAMDILTGNWDGPLINKNNFYLYQNTETSRFEYIPYDLDNTFGIDFIGVDWGTAPVYDWADMPDRPLFTQLMELKEFRDLMSFYMDDIMQSYFNNQLLDVRIDDIAQKIRPFVINDPHFPLDYGYTITDFDMNIQSGLTGGAGHDDDYGLKDWISTRTASAQNEIVVNDIKTVIQYYSYEIDLDDQKIYFRAFFHDNNTVNSPKLEYITNSGQTVTAAMFDDGMNNDGSSGDDLYGTSIDIPDDLEKISFRFTAINTAAAQTTVPCEFDEINFRKSDIKLFINEIMAVNDQSITDEAGEYDDWLEIYNGGESAIFLGDKYLTDNENRRDKWKMPAITINPGEFIVFWADEDQSQGQRHTNFRLSSQGEFIGLYDADQDDFVEIDAFYYGTQEADVSYGYTVDGFGSPGKLSNVTPGETNNPQGSSVFVLFPNPTFSGTINFVGVTVTEVKLISLDAKEVYSFKTEPTNQIDLPGNISNGMYIMDLKDVDGEWVRRTIQVYR